MQDGPEKPFKLSKAEDFIITAIGLVIIGLLAIGLAVWIIDSVTKNNSGYRNNTPMTEQEYMDQQSEFDYYRDRGY